jgi:hypothetical protein
LPPGIVKRRQPPAASGVDDAEGSTDRSRSDVALSLAFFSDPDGTTLYLAEMKPAYR